MISIIVDANGAVCEKVVAAPAGIGDDGMCRGDEGEQVDPEEQHHGAANHEQKSDPTSELLAVGKHGIISCVLTPCCCDEIVAPTSRSNGGDGATVLLWRARGVEQAGLQQAPRRRG